VCQGSSVAEVHSEVQHSVGGGGGTSSSGAEI